MYVYTFKILTVLQENKLIINIVIKKKWIYLKDSTMAH